MLPSIDPSYDSHQSIRDSRWAKHAASHRTAKRKVKMHEKIKWGRDPDKDRQGFIPSSTSCHCISHFLACMHVPTQRHPNRHPLQHPPPGASLALVGSGLDLHWAGSHISLPLEAVGGLLETGGWHSPTDEASQPA